MNELDRAKDIARQVLPGCRPDTTCMLVQSAIAGMRGLTMRHIRIGALFWPEQFKDDPALSMRGGWGCEGFDERTGRLYFADPTVDDLDGGFSGHTWLEPAPEEVVDLMHGVTLGPRARFDGRMNIVASYIPRRELERAVKAYWRPQMQAAIKMGRKQ